MQRLRQKVEMKVFLKSLQSMSIIDPTCAQRQKDGQCFLIKYFLQLEQTKLGIQYPKNWFCIESTCYRIPGYYPFMHYYGDSHQPTICQCEYKYTF